LSGVDIDGGFGLVFETVFDAHGAFENEGVFVELGRLAWFDPAAGAAHVGYADALGSAVDAADVFVDELGFRAGGGYAGGFVDEYGFHGQRGW
jgi:hypothetical protein